MISVVRGGRLTIAVLLSLSVVACTRAGNDASTTVSDSTAALNRPLAGAPDKPVAGPQGRVPQFLVECPLSHTSYDDPIVFPNAPDASHLHAFFGNNGTNAASTYESLLTGTTNCDQPADTAAYWVPALMQGDTMIPPIKSVAYYRPGEGVDPTAVQPYPPGLKIVAGDGDAEQAQNTAVVAFTCGTAIRREVLPPSCPEHRPLRMMVTFPDCWDGVNVDSDDHASHMTYSSGGACPATHPVPVAQLQFSVDYGFSGDPAGLSLSSGSMLTGHADFFNGWVQNKLAAEIRTCLHRKVVCGITSGRV